MGKEYITAGNWKPKSWSFFSSDVVFSGFHVNFWETTIGMPGCPTKKSWGVDVHRPRKGAGRDRSWVAKVEHF